MKVEFTKTRMVGALFVVSCMLLVSGIASAKPIVSMDSSQWTVYWLTPASHTNKSAQASDGGVAFDFLREGVAYATHLLAHFSGDLTGKTLTAVVRATVSSPFLTWVYNPANGCYSDEVIGRPNVRPVFMTTTSAPHNETDVWWPYQWYTLAYMSGATITLSVSFADLSVWYDLSGHWALDPAYTDAFLHALANVKLIGLSFGGGACFDNGVAIQDGSASFELVSLDVSG